MNERQEHRATAAIILIAIGVTFIPFIVGTFTAGNRAFLATQLPDVADTPVYFSNIDQAADGNFLLRNLFTGEVQRFGLFHPLWLVLGWIAGLTGWAAPTVFHLVRAILGVVFLVVIARLLRQTVTSPWLRLLGLGLVGLGGGLGGWFLLGLPHSYVELLTTPSLIARLPADILFPHVTTAGTLNHSPLFIASQLLVLGFFMTWVRLECPSDRPRQDRRQASDDRTSLLLGGFAILVALVHPYDVPILIGVLLGMIIIRIAWTRQADPQLISRHLRRLGIITLCLIPVALAFVALVVREPAFAAWSSQNINQSPHPASYLLGYGFLIPLAVLGVRPLLRRQRSLDLLVLSWAATSVVLAYIPVNLPFLPLHDLQRRFLNGTQLALIVLALQGISVLWMWARGHGRLIRSLVHWGIILALASSFLTVPMVIRLHVRSLTEDAPYHYRSRSFANAAVWLRAHACSDAVTLAHAQTANLLPQFTTRPIYAGHRIQTVDWPEKRERVMAWFFKGDTPADERDAFLRREDISYLWYGNEERRLGSYDPDGDAVLRRVFVNDEVAIYRVSGVISSCGK